MIHLESDYNNGARQAIELAMRLIRLVVLLRAGQQRSRKLLNWSVY